MSAAEEDTELRDLLVQNLENSGVLNKIKAELRAAVFLALEEQEKIESKTPLVNESLKRCLNTKDGRLVASLITDYLQVFNLDFTLAVFHPEINTLNGLESREAVARELGITEPEGNKNTPLLLEIVKRGRHKEKGSSSSAEELSPKQIAEARKKFEHYDKDKSGEISKDELRTLFIDLFPHFHKNMLERYVTDEFRAVDKNFSNSIDFNEFLGMYKRLFIQCRSVVTCDVSDIVQTPSTFIEEKISTTSASKIPRYKGLDKQREEKAGEKGIEESYCDTSMKNKSNIQLSSRGSKLSENSKEAPLVKSVRDLDVDVDVDEEEEEEGDSFFDDPLPKPQKTYGCLSKADKISESSFSENKMSNSHKEINWSLKEKSISGASFSQMKKNSSLNDLSAINSDTDDDVDDPFADNGNGYNPGGRRTNPGKPVTSLTSLSDAPPLKSGLGSLSGVPPLTDVFESTNGNCTDGGLKDLKTMNDKIGSLGLGDEDEEYDDDFNSTSHRSDKTKSEVSIGEEIEEVSIEGVDFNASDKLEDLTQDHSISQFSEAADYMEEVASVSQK
ncbi:centrosomal protein 43 isoform X2 [Amia ocellicauda]|uniref:centrosomal protein 43 isoform X2 n=1 Tax=Amia ocellicauda TaxID=2972642 RepID=UPI003463F4D0